MVDSSSDRTPNIAGGAGRPGDPAVSGARLRSGHGHRPASGKGKVIVTLDCDDTYPTEQIPHLARLVLEDHDIVDGSRLQRKPEAMPWLNYLANYGFALVASVLFRQRLTDLHSGMRAYRKTLIDELKYQPRGAALPVELLLRPLKMGKHLKVVFIDYRERIGQTTMQPLQSTGGRHGES